MICVSITDIDQKKYQQLILYLLSNCNQLSFHFPGVYSDGSVLSDEMWKKYHKEAAPLLSTCFNSGAKMEISKHYHGMKLGLYSKIITVPLFDQLKSLLLENHLFDWLVENSLPEDVCFLSNNNLRVFTCSHEEEFFIYSGTPLDVEFLRKNSFDFWIHK